METRTKYEIYLTIFSTKTDSFRQIYNLNVKDSERTIKQMKEWHSPFFE